MIASFRPVSIIVVVILICAPDTYVHAQISTPESTITPPSSTYPASSANPASQPAQAAVPLGDQSHYVISSGDVLEVTVFGAPDLSQRAIVNNSGDIYLPLIDNIHVAGMHIEDAQTAVEQAFLKRDVLKSPHVSIVVTNFSSGVILMGEVARPGFYPIVGSGRLFDILAEAGGITQTAGQAITITHKNGVSQQMVHLSSDAAQSFAANVPMQQGDMVIVSKAGVIYVVGEVLAPSGFLMDEKGQYSVMKAVAMAHGLTKLAQSGKARIVRKTPFGQQEIPVRLNKILHSKAPDVPMQANDILFIPSSKSKMAAVRAADVAVSLASGVAYYGIYH